MYSIVDKNQRVPSNHRVAIRKFPNMNLFLLVLIFVRNDNCLAAGLDEVSENMLPRMRRMSQMRRITQSKPQLNKFGQLIDASYRPFFRPKTSFSEYSL